MHMLSQDVTAVLILIAVFYPSVLFKGFDNFKGAAGQMV